MMLNGCDCPSTAHPRVGGENLTFVPCVMRLAGSSPRRRGKLNVTLTITPAHRLIPA